MAFHFSRSPLSVCCSEEPHASDPGGEAGAEHQRGRERRSLDARRKGPGALDADDTMTPHPPLLIDGVETSI